MLLSKVNKNIRRDNMSKIRRLTKNVKNSRKTLKKLNILEKVANGGKIFSVIFIKKNGTERVMSCRRGVKRYLKGGVNTCSHIPIYYNVFSCNDKGYRNVNLNTLKTVKGCGAVYNF